METKQKKIGAGDVLLLVFSAAFLAGILTVFSPCGPKEDGSWMTCHWAGQAVRGLAALLTVFALLHILVQDGKVKAGLDLAVIPTALLAAVLPGNLIGLCMMGTMRCHAVMRPAVLVMSVLVAAAAVFDLILRRKRGAVQPPRRREIE